MRMLRFLAVLALAVLYAGGPSHGLEVEKRDAIDALAPKDQYCAVGSGHTACKYRQTNQDGKCGSIVKRELTADQKQKLLDKHNELRRKVAKGQQSGQPGAANMAKLEWDDEAAAIAQIWVDQCFGLQHDSSRETVKGGKTYNGQNLYMGFGREGSLLVSKQGPGAFPGRPFPGGTRPPRPNPGGFPPRPIPGGIPPRPIPPTRPTPGGSNGGQTGGNGGQTGGNGGQTGGNGGQTGGNGGQTGGNGGGSGGGSGDFNVETAVQLWYDEVQKFSSSGISPFAFSSGTGHYTQVVWAETTKIGCGYIKYSGGEVLACNYKPGGNMQGASMYKTGSSCSACPSSLSKCEDGLCTK